MTTKVETCGVVTGTFIIVSDLRADRALVFRIDVLYKKRKKVNEHLKFSEERRRLDFDFSILQWFSYSMHF